MSYKALCLKSSITQVIQLKYRREAMEKKTATSIEVLIKVAQYESILLSKYSEAKIEYESEEERVEKEDQLNDEVVADLIRTMRSLPDKLGKKTNAVAEIEEKIQKRIPEWLENNPEPNIANVTKRSHERADAKAHADAEEKKVQETNATVTDVDTDMADLFGDDGGENASEADVSEEKPEVSEETEKLIEPTKKEPESEKSDDDFLDNDEDLFG